MNKLSNLFSKKEEADFFFFFNGVQLIPNGPNTSYVV